MLDERVDRSVGERRQLDRLPVAVPAVRHEGVEHRLQGRVGLGLEQVDERAAELLERADDLGTLVRRSRVTGADHHHRLAPHLLRHEGEWRWDRELEDRRQLVGRIGDELAVEAQHLGRVGQRVEDRPREHGRADGMKSVLERGDDPEVAAAAADAPEEIGVLLLAGTNELALGRHDVRRRRGCRRSRRTSASATRSRRRGSALRCRYG